MNWVKELKEHAMPGIVLAIVGNKCDLERERRIEKKIITELAPKENIIARRGLNDWVTFMGIKIPKNMAAL